jgi:hypothetical protein
MKKTKSICKSAQILKLAFFYFFMICSVSLQAQEKLYWFMHGSAMDKKGEYVNPPIFISEVLTIDCLSIHDGRIIQKEFEEYYLSNYGSKYGATSVSSYPEYYKTKAVAEEKKASILNYGGEVNKNCLLLSGFNYNCDVANKKISNNQKSSYVPKQSQGNISAKQTADKKLNEQKQIEKKDDDYWQNTKSSNGSEKTNNNKPTATRLPLADQSGNKNQNSSNQNVAVTNENVTKSNNYITEGNELQRQGNYTAAKEKYNQALEVNPYSATAKSNINTANTNISNKQSVNNYNNGLLQQAAQGVASDALKIEAYKEGFTQLAGLAQNFLADRAEQKERDRQAAESARIAEQIRLEKIAAQKRLVENRKATIAKFPDGKMPLSSLSRKANEVYYFIYNCDEATLESESPIMYISNAFPVEKYADDTWPFKNKVMEEIAKTNKGLNFKLSGFYMTKSEADEQLQQLVNDAYKYYFTVKDVFYMSKKSTGKVNTNTDFWGNESNKKGQEINTETKDTPEPTNSNAQVDYWGNSTTKKAQEPKQAQKVTPKPTKPNTQVDFWGNPIKKN